MCALLAFQAPAPCPASVRLHGGEPRVAVNSPDGRAPAPRIGSRCTNARAQPHPHTPHTHTHTLSLSLMLSRPAHAEPTPTLFFFFWKSLPIFFGVGVGEDGYPGTACSPQKRDPRRKCVYARLSSGLGTNTPASPAPRPLRRAGVLPMPVRWTPTHTPARSRTHGNAAPQLGSPTTPNSHRVD